MVVEDEGRTLTVGAGNYVFLKRDHKVKLLKHAADGAPYKAISIRFERGFLRDFFSRMDKAALPSDVRRIREAAVLLPFMEANYTQDMTLEEFATYTGRSLATFKRDFAKLSDLSPEKWLIRKRLDKAYEMLRDGKLKPSEVYYEVGFKNRSHFSIAFKRQFGVSPGGVAASV